MKYMLTVTLLGIAVVGCSSRSSPLASVTETTHSNPDIAEIAPEERFTQEFHTGEADSPLPVMSPNVPAILLTPVAGNDTTSPTDSFSTGNWQTFTSSALGISLAYPTDWLAAEEADGILFTSPTGMTSQMRADTSGIDQDEFKIGNQYCTSRTNEHHLTAEICADRNSFLYTAKFSLQTADGATRWLSLSTKNRGAGEVFEVMFESLQLTH